MLGDDCFFVLLGDLLFFGGDGDRFFVLGGDGVFDRFFVLLGDVFFLGDGDFFFVLGELP